MSVTQFRKHLFMGQKNAKRGIVKNSRDFIGMQINTIICPLVQYDLTQTTNSMPML